MKRNMDVIVKLGGREMNLARYEAFQREAFQSEAEIAISETATLRAYSNIHDQAWEEKRPNEHISWAYERSWRMRRQRDVTLKEIRQVKASVGRVIAKCRDLGVPDAELECLFSLMGDMEIFLDQYSE
jgi:hypothetical protein